jgi:hypothetical protein
MVEWWRWAWRTARIVVLGVLLAVGLIELLMAIGVDVFATPVLRSPKVAIGLVVIALFFAAYQARSTATNAGAGAGVALSGFATVPFILVPALEPVPAATTAGFWKGSVAWQLERTMTVDQPYSMIVVVSGAKTFDLKGFAQTMGGSGSVDAKEVDVPDVLVARLHGQPRSVFSVVPEKADPQTIGVAGDMRWSLDVTPKQEGAQKLLLELYAVVKPRGGPDAIQNVFRQPIPITVEAVAWYTSVRRWAFGLLTGPWLWGLIGAGILGLAGKELLAMARLCRRRIIEWWRRRHSTPSADP